MSININLEEEQALMTIGCLIAVLDGMRTATTEQGAEFDDMDALWELLSSFSQQMAEQGSPVSEAIEGLDPKNLAGEETDE